MTVITASMISNVDELLLKLREPWAHQYPYRVFVGVSDWAPYSPRAVLLVHRSGRLFLADPEAGPLEFQGDDCRLGDNPADQEWSRSYAYLRLVLERWLARWGHQVLELHPTLTTEDPQGMTRRRPSDYFSAVRVSVEARLQASGRPNWSYSALLTRMDRLRADALRRENWTPENRRIHWRGAVLDQRSYRSLRATFKDEVFVGAVAAAKMGGDCSSLLAELNSAGCEFFFTDEWIHEISNGELARADCGHVECACDVVGTWDGSSTYCQACADDELVYVTQCRPGREGFYVRDEVYYWESDGEYHLEPEPEPDDEGEDEDEDEGTLLQGWSTSTSHLDHDRSFTPTWYGDFTMGVELEVETREYDRGAALRDCDDQFNAEAYYAMFKRDGSLNSEKGFEIVTAARRLCDHIAAFSKWNPYKGLRSWDSGNCGMHVHIDSRAFTPLALGKFLQFYNDPANARFIRSIAGRHPDTDSQARAYAARVECSQPNPANIKKTAGQSRYRLVNLTNLTNAEQQRLAVEARRDSKGAYSTVELRIFRGTLKKERLLAQLEFAHASVQFCRAAGMHQLNGPGFLTWLGSVAGQYKHLARWFGVYVPRPTKQRPTPTTASAIQETAEV